jgi:Tfp pilus assembly protein PilX
MKNYFKKNYFNKKGVALIITILLMSLILILGIYVLSFSLTEQKIAQSQTWGAKTYYLAEAGIAEMVWKLKNDETYKTSFETNPSWTTQFTRDDPFGENSGSYTVTITNSSAAHGEITAVGSIGISEENNTQRIVKTYVYRAMGQGSTELGDNCGYADGNIDISFSNVNFYNGSAHSNNNFIINGGSTVNVDTDLKAVNNYNKTSSFVNVGGEIYAANEPNGPAESIAMPAIDFDSASPESYKNIADVVYTEREFEDMLEDEQPLILEESIVYVDGDIILRDDQGIVINGLLVVDRDLKIGRSPCWGWLNPEFSSITINHTAGQPSGIFAKRKVYFEFFAGDINVDGVIYAGDQLYLMNFPFGHDFFISGGLISRKLTATSIWTPINITRDEEIISSTIGVFELSPVITVEHWEEEY